MNSTENNWVPTDGPIEALSTESEALSTQDEGPSTPIKEFHIRREDFKKARRMREALAESAPGISGRAIAATVILIRPKVPKNRMFACDAAGKRVLTINLKNGTIEFTGAF